MKTFILDKKGNPTLEENFSKWGEWFETADRKVGRDEVGSKLVSTVFLGLDHQCGNGPPELYETMIFDGEDEFIERYSTKEEAIVGHRKALSIALGDKK